MLTFEQWLKAYTEKYGTPPAVVMAEAAYKYAKEHAYNAGFNDGKLVNW